MKRPSPWLHILIAASTLMAIAAAFVLSARTQRALRDMAAEEFNQQQLILAHSAANSIEIYFKALIADLSALASMPEAYGLMPEHQKILEQTYWGFPRKTSIRLLDHKGVLRYIYPRGGWRKELVGKDYSQEAYFRQAIATDRITLSPLIYNEQGEARIRIAVPISLPDDTDPPGEKDGRDVAVTLTDPAGQKDIRVRGVLVGSVNPAIISRDFISPIVSGKTGYAWLLDSEGTFLSHHLNEFVGRNAFRIRHARNPFFSYDAINNIQHLMMVGAEGKDRYISGWHRTQDGEVEKLVAYSPIQILNGIWSVAVCAPVNEVEGIVNRAQRSEQQSLALVTAVLLLCGAFFFITRYRWSRSLEREVKRQTRDLKANEKRMRAILNASPMGVSLLINRKMIWFNKAMHDMLGYDDAFLGEDVMALYPNPAEYERVGRELYADVDGSGTGNMETKLVRKDGTFLDCYLQTCAVDTSDPSQGYIVAIVDISEQKKHDRQKKELENRLRQAEKMEIIGSLAGGIAHDFNNILFPIVGYTEILLHTAPEGSDSHDLLDRILKAADRAKDLVRQILTFSRQSDTGLKPIRLQPTVKEALKLLRASIPATIEIRQRIENGNAVAMGNPTQVHQIVMNLCTNAYHAMEDQEGGKLEVSLTEVELENGVCDLMNMKPGLYLELTVSDTGSGIAPKILNRIFEPYFTTKETGKGTGMGLSVVYGIVKDFNGEIRVNSCPGKGSAFHVYLPAVHTGKNGVEKSGRDHFSGGKERVLLVDDDEDAISVQEEMLKQLGYTVIRQTSSLAALEMFRRDPKIVDFVITDLTMPNLTGDKLSRELANIRPCIPIILCTGSNESMSEEKAKRLGIKGFFRKPVKTGVLAKIVRKALDNSEKPGEI